LREFHTETGRSLLDLVDESPVLLIFLRHFACAFCAQTLDRVAQVRAQIEAKGVRPVFVHLGSPERAKPYFDYYHLSDVERISNPQATLYQLPAFACRAPTLICTFSIRRSGRAGSRARCSSMESA
jgi:peroxiredoxin